MIKKNNLIVCKNDEILEKYKSICSDDNIEKICINYIIAKYKVQTTYSNGFKTNYRINIAFINNGNIIIGPSESFTTEASTTIEIIFLSLLLL